MLGMAWASHVVLLLAYGQGSSAVSGSLPLLGHEPGLHLSRTTSVSGAPRLARDQAHRQRSRLPSGRKSSDQRFRRAFKPKYRRLGSGGGSYGISGVYPTIALAHTSKPEFLHRPRRKHASRVPSRRGCEEKIILGRTPSAKKVRVDGISYEVIVLNAVIQNGRRQHERQSIYFR